MHSVGVVGEAAVQVRDNLSLLLHAVPELEAPDEGRDPGRIEGRDGGEEGVELLLLFGGLWIHSFSDGFVGEGVLVVEDRAPVRLAV